ncbi:hypothetical protein GA0061098_1002368 [Bradyrhizobium shewense]|uniref:Uncharacterized protein n=1 Tax=Bradyrhizobium shewense TaxID=1761772 RepID=A0A1C3USE8_9BRAD|nr:hypothetical protein GA0061098_1002368 [Bradyrhizobium shewense]
MLNGVANGLEQSIVGEWLGQEFDRTRFHCPHGRRHVPVSGNKNDWHVRAITCQANLKFETIQIGQIHIKDKTAGSLHSWMRKEPLS